jgi:hypothetical protein
MRTLLSHTPLFLQNRGTQILSILTFCQWVYTRAEYKRARDCVKMRSCKLTLSRRLTIPPQTRNSSEVVVGRATVLPQPAPGEAGRAHSQHEERRRFKAFRLIYGMYEFVTLYLVPCTNAIPRNCRRAFPDFCTRRDPSSHAPGMDMASQSLANGGIKFAHTIQGHDSAFRF